MAPHHTTQLTTMLCRCLSSSSVLTLNWGKNTEPLKRLDCAILILLLVSVLAARSPFILDGVFGNDAAYHARAAVTIIHGGLLYRDVPYTYPPLYAYTEALAIEIFGNTNLGWKATAQIYDLGSIILIYLIVSHISNKKNALIAAALYGISPLPFFATSSFISFDSTAAFWMLTSLWLLLLKKPLPSAIALGIGTAYKYFPLLLIPAVLIYLSNKRQKTAYILAAIGTVTLIQLPFILTDFSSWLNNVIIYYIERPAEGVTIYNLISLHPQLFNVSTPLTLLSPISLMLVYLLVAFTEGKSEIGLFKNSTFIIVSAIFFSKVVLFYALWYVPLVCILILFLRRRLSAIVLVPFFILQASLILGGYSYSMMYDLQNVLIAGYIYLVTSCLLLIWLLHDRLISSKRINNKVLLYHWDSGNPFFPFISQTLCQEQSFWVD